MWCRTIRILTGTALLALVGACLFAGQRTAAAAEYAIQPEDVVSIRVSGEPALSQNYTVDEKGEISLETIGKVRLAGLTARQAQEKLTRELGRFLKIFEVMVSVVGETGTRVLVFGEVAKPGPVRLRQGGKLLDVLAEAGQLGPNADSKRIAVMRHGGSTAREVDLDAVLKDPSLNLELGPGDTVTVPSKSVRSVRVDGDVQMPGVKSLEEVRTVFAAVQAAGPKAGADWKRIVLRRRGSGIPLMIDLSQVRTGQLKDDLELQEGDQVTVLSRFAGLATLRGEVTNPGEKELNGPTQLWDFILTSGGGFSKRADRRRVQIIRAGKMEEVVDLVAIENGTRRSDDPQLQLQPGDVVFVPTGTAVLRGEVKTTGEQVIGNSSQLWDFITAVGGGFTDAADRTGVQLIRDGKPIRTVDLTQLASGLKTADDPELEVRPGDTVFVPNNEAKRFVIVGGVKKPGAYTVKQGMTVVDAIAAADGLNERAKTKEIVIAPADRFDKDGKLKDAPAGGQVRSKDAKALGLVVVDLKKQNPVLAVGDRIYVPEQPPADGRAPKVSLLERVLRVLPVASLFLGGGGGYYPGSYGGFGY